MEYSAWVLKGWRLLTNHSSLQKSLVKKWVGRHGKGAVLVSIVDQPGTPMRLDGAGTNVLPTN